jgi:hypothetical protein
MKSSTMALYWKVIAYSCIVGISLAIGILTMYYLTFANEFTSATFGDAVRWGALLGLLTTVMVIAGTIATARRLDTPSGKALFILLSFLSPLVGWILFGIVNGVLVGWEFFFGAPLIAGVSSVVALLVGAVATFFMPSTRLDDHLEDGGLDSLLQQGEREL